MSRDAIFFIMGIVIGMLFVVGVAFARGPVRPNTDPAVLASSRAAVDAANDARAQAHANGAAVQRLGANIKELTGELSKVQASLFCLHEEYRHPDQVKQDGGYYGCEE